MEQRNDFFAFISYKREDEKWAKWLENELEHYHLPTTLNGKELPKNLRPIFRDVDELSAGNLPEQIFHALSISKNLIVVCSPRSAQSEWVNKEIEDFIKIKGGKADNIYPFIIEGVPFSKNADKECFPEKLRNLPENEERLGGNINEQGGRNAAVVKIIAGMLGIGFDSLWQKYEREQRRKRWVWVVGSILLALMGLGIGSYYIKQNRIIETQNIKLKKAIVSQDISLTKAYLSQSRPEMALIAIKKLEYNKSYLDSIQMNDYSQLWISLSDTLLNYPLLLTDIKDTSEYRTNENKWNSISGKVIHFRRVNNVDNHNFLSLCINNEASCYKDTIPIYGNPNISIQFNSDLTLLSTYSLKSDNIEVYSINSGEIVGRIDCVAYYPWMAYPMAISKNGQYIIYCESDKYWWRVCLVDMITKDTKTIKYSSGYLQEDLCAAFSSNDKYFYIKYLYDNSIEIYSNETKSIIHTLKYEDSDNVFWNDSTDICVSSHGQIYTWEIITNEHNKYIHVEGGVNSISMNAENRLVAITSSNRKVYIWDVVDNKCLWSEEVFEDIEDYPQDAIFTLCDQSLWVLSAYNNIKRVDYSRSISQIISYEEPGLDYAHPWDGSLCLSKDGKYCISWYDYRDAYYIYDMKGNLIGESHYDEIKGSEHTKDILSNFIPIERFYLDEEEGSKHSSATLVVRRYSSDGKYYLDGYDDGIVKVLFKRNKLLVDSLIMKQRGERYR